jgi:hypothetical protein
MHRRCTATDQHRARDGDGTRMPAGGPPAGGLPAGGSPAALDRPALARGQAGLELELDLVGHLQGSEQS